MRPRNMVIVSVSFILFGIIVLIMGVSMLIMSTRYLDPNDMHATVLRISGRVACVTGGILVASTLSTCLYLCIIGAQYNFIAQPDYSSSSSQLTKVTQAPARPRLAQAATAAGHRWSTNEKFYTSQTLSRSMNPKGFLPSGDITELRRDGQFGEFLGRQAKTSLGPLHATNWSNSAQFSCARSSGRRRGRSVDPSDLGLDYIPTLSAKQYMAPVNSPDFKLNCQSARRIWMPSLNNQNTLTLTQAPRTEYGTSHLIGLTLEPLGSLLYSEGRVKLGSHL